MRQLLTESLVLAFLGAGGGMVMAVWGTATFRRMGVRTQDFLAQTETGLTNLGFQGIGMDLRTLAFGLCLTLLTALLFGLGPALRASRSDLNAALKVGAGLDRRRIRPSRLTPSFPATLVAAQVALALVLLVGSGLLVRSLGRLLTAEVGYNGEQVLSARVELPRDQYGDYSSYGSERSARFLTELAERARHIPGVEVAALARCVPFSGSCPGNGVILPDRPQVDRSTWPIVRVNMVEGDYFGALGIRLERGRLFRPGDDGAAPQVAVVNRTAAELFWPGEDPIGRPIQGRGWFGPNTVVGVVADVRYESIESPPAPMLYVPLAQVPAMGGVLVIRGRGDPLMLVEGLKTHLRELDPNLPLAEVKTMSEWVAEATFTPRFSAILLGLFAAVALLLSTLGVYGVLSVVVARQTQEVGVRMALGAGKKDVLEVVVRRAVGMVLPGLVVGLLLAFLFTRLLEALLFGIHPRDPATFLGGALALMLTGAAATLIPALRATRVDPVEALKAE